MTRAAFAESEIARPAGDYHKFDLSGLGPAPYAFLGMEEKVCAGLDVEGRWS